MLLDQYVALVEGSGRATVARTESRQRAIEHAIALPCTLGVRTGKKRTVRYKECRGVLWQRGADLHETRDSRSCISNIEQNLTRHAYT